MLCQSFLTVPIPYQTLEEIQRLNLAPDIYGPGIPAPWGENLNGIYGLWEEPDTDRIVLAAQFNQKVFPGYDLARLEFNGVTGAFEARSNRFLTTGDDVYSFGYYFRGVVQDVYGNLWAHYIAGSGTVTGYAQQISRTNFRAIPDTRVLPSRFGLISISVFVFDVARDYALIGANQEVRVHRFATGELLYTLQMPSFVSVFAPGERTQVYALLQDRTIVAIDYLARRVFQHTRLPINASDGNPRIAWSAKNRRLLYIAPSPDAEDGSSTTRIYGYRNQPVATAVCKPVPLKPARVGRVTPVLVKQIGDVGEGLAGQLQVTESDYLSAAVPTANAASFDGDGEAVISVTGLAEGTASLDVSIDVACTLAAPRIPNPLNTAA